MYSLKIINAYVITPSGIIENGTVLLDDEKIAAVVAEASTATAAQTIDAEGKFVAPGFIDLHVHGGGGHDFMDLTVEAFLKTAEHHAIYGTTAMMPTTLSSNSHDLFAVLDLYREADRLNTAGAKFIGLHIEGPYLAMAQKGAQDPRYLRNPDPEEYEEVIRRADFVKRWSVAPELPGALEMGRFLRAHGVMGSVAHTDAICEEVLEAFDAGFTHITHMYSCMSTVTRRNAYKFGGAIEATYLLDDMTVELIADGRHLPASLLKLVYKIKGPSKIALVTDAMRGAGLKEGKSILGGLKDGLEVIIEDDVAKLPDRTAFAGSVATTDRLVKTMIREAEVPFLEAVAMMTSVPAGLAGVAAKKGSIEDGKDADIVIFDDAIKVAATIIGGKVVYQDNRLKRIRNV